MTDKGIAFFRNALYGAVISDEELARILADPKSIRMRYCEKAGYVDLVKLNGRIVVLNCQVHSHHSSDN